MPEPGPRSRGDNRNPSGRSFATNAASLVATLVAAAFGLTLRDIRGRRRGPASSATARQLAMYLVHVGYGVAQRDVGLAFGRDRTTVAHACARIEDQRDDVRFDRMVTCLEAALGFGGRRVAGQVGGR